MQWLLRTGALVALLAGCAMTPAESTQSQDVEAYQICPEQRPDICTQEYRPVCGLTFDEAQHTYGNACTACADEQVYGFLTGECE